MQKKKTLISDEIYFGSSLAIIGYFIQIESNLNRHAYTVVRLKCSNCLLTASAGLLFV